MTEVYPVIGMSPGNSYFKDEVVKSLLRNVIEQYGKAAVLIADIPAISTYVALGYPKNRAWRDKALPQSNGLRNKIQRGIEELRYSGQQVRVISWKDEIEDNIQYTTKLEQVTKLYETSEPFRKATNDATAEVLENSDKEIPNFDESIKIAVHYLLSEIAFMEYAPNFLNTNKAIYIYHRNWPVYENYIVGKFDRTPRPYLGFSIVTT